MMCNILFSYSWWYSANKNNVCILLLYFSYCPLDYSLDLYMVLYYVVYKSICLMFSEICSKRNKYNNNVYFFVKASSWVISFKLYTLI